MATSKKPKSVTRESLFADLAIVVKSVKVLGKLLHVRPISEVRRSARSAEAFDDKGNLRKEFADRRRIYAIIDHVCDSDGELLFTDRDIDKIAEMDSMVVDSYYDAITSTLGVESEGNE
jgi:hypothetical protein